MPIDIGKSMHFNVCRGKQNFVNKKCSRGMIIINK